MRLFFAGAEVPSHRKLLADSGVSDVSLSYMGLRRKVKFARPWIIADHFLPSQNVFLDSGTYTLNKEDSEVDEDEAREIAAQYLAFVQQNIDGIEMAAEFDAKVLGREWIDARREDFWESYPDKFLPVWHREYGRDELERMASLYPRVGVLQSALEVRDMGAQLNALVDRYGVRFHGVGMTRMKPMQEIRWDSVGSTSWLDPGMNGGTFVWDGHELHRYPKRYKERARRQHNSVFVSNGFDVAKIEEDDTNELLRLSLWSWSKFVDSINARKVFDPFGNTKAGLAINPSVNENEDNADPEGSAVDNPPGQTRNAELVVPRETTPLPGLGLVTETSTVKRKNPDGTETEEEVSTTVLGSSGDSLRHCDTCILRDKGCPKFEPGAACGYGIPVVIRTPKQLDALADWTVERQTARVAFMLMYEEMRDGYVDPNTGVEIDRLNRLITARNKAKETGVSFKIEGHAPPAQSGVLTEIFGGRVADQASALPQPISVESYVEAIDAEVLDDGK